jgi:hypothetical protein
VTPGLGDNSPPIADQMISGLNKRRVVKLQWPRFNIPKSKKRLSRIKAIE